MQHFSFGFLHFDLDDDDDYYCYCCFAFQYQLLEGVGSSSVRLWGQQEGWWRSSLTAPGLRLLSGLRRGIQADPYADRPEFLARLQHIILLNLHSNKC